MAFGSISNRITRIVNRDIEREEKDLQLVHSISKQLLEELKHAHGLDPNELGHVKREVASLIEALKESDRVARHAERVLKRMNHEVREHARKIGQDFERIEHYDKTVLEYLQGMYHRLDAWDRQSVRQLVSAINLLDDFVGNLHKEIHADIFQRKIPGHERMAYEPPNHRAA